MLIKMHLMNKYLMYHPKRITMFILFLFHALLSCNGQNSTNKSDGGWPKDVNGLIKHLNEWSPPELDIYERPLLYPNHKTSGETNGWIEEHKNALKILGAEVTWDSTVMKYKLKKQKLHYNSKGGEFTIWYDSLLWRCDTTTRSLLGEAPLSDARFYFIKHIGTMASCYQTKDTIPTKNITSYIETFYSNYGKVVSVVTVETITVNNEIAIAFDLELETEGSLFQFAGRIYSSSLGSFQFVVSSQKEFFTEDKNEIRDLLNDIMRKSQFSD